MKKIITLLICLICLSSVVFADAIGPEFPIVPSIRNNNDMTLIVCFVVAIIVVGISFLITYLVNKKANQNKEEENEKN